MCFISINQTVASLVVGNSEGFSSFITLVQSSNCNRLFQTGGGTGAIQYISLVCRREEPHFLFSFLRHQPQDEAWGRSQERECSLTFTPSTSSS
ncbi:hypothetical protein LDENG_00183360 [Lucifuga dentata]|nr:hypothetical protein LDENG_00183360 [Lucifuga dentata]